MLAAFDFTSWYAYLAYVGAAYLFWRAVGKQLIEDARAVRRKVKPEPVQRPSPSEVSLGNISASISYTQDEGAPHRRLGTIKVTYLVINDNDNEITDVTTGVRPSGTYEGGQHLEWRTSQIRPRSQATVQEVEVPPELFRDVHESVAQKAFIFWVRFKDHRGEEWEVWRDAGTDQSDKLFHPDPLE